MTGSARIIANVGRVLLLVVMFALAPAADADEGEGAFWSRIEVTGDALMFETYLRAFPDGAHAAQARRRLDALRAGDDQASVPRRKSYPPTDAGWIGVKYDGIRLAEIPGYDGSDEFGMLVVDVMSFGPNAASGLAPGDVIVALDGRGLGKIEDLGEQIPKSNPGSTMAARIMRNGEPVDLTLYVGGTPTDVRPAAEAGDPAAQWFMALAYHSGSGVPANPEKAFIWARRSAEGRHTGGLAYAGYYYLHGIGTAKDEAKAADLFAEAAARDEPTAVYWMGVIHENGLGGRKRSRQTAVGYYRRAALLGNNHAANNLKRLEVVPFDLAETVSMLERLGLEVDAADTRPKASGGTGPGARTRAAIVTFQKAKGMNADGKPSLDLARAVRRELVFSAYTRPIVPAAVPAADAPSAAQPTDTRPAASSIRALDTLD